MKLDYFEQEKADEDDHLLKRAIKSGDVPPSCLLGGEIVFTLVCKDVDPCEGCAGPRKKCHGR